jgi:predicted nucleic acid-binding protein
VIYLDTNVIIRFIEGDSSSRESIRVRLTDENLFTTSQLSRLECRCRPMRANDTALLAVYDLFFSANGLRMIEINAKVIDEATSIRAFTGLKSPDALHLAAAIVGGATLFLTGDVQLTRFTRLPVEII